MNRHANRSLGFFLALLAVPAAFGAIGCTLGNPASDLKSLFAEMTSYREDVRELGKLPDGREAYLALRERVGGDLDPVYEAFDVPYTLYSVFKGEEKIGSGPCPTPKAQSKKNDQSQENKQIVPHRSHFPARPQRY